MLTKARPGGSINAFCEPVITTSSPHSSVFISNTPSAVIASTTNMVSACFFTISAIAFVSWATPVDVSLACINTAFIVGSFLNAFSTSSGLTA